MILNTLPDKIRHAKEIIRISLKKHKKVAVACSFGKDSMVITHLAREVDSKIPVFSIMTIYKPKETLQYLVDMNNKMKLNVNVFMVANKIPEIFKKNKIKVTLLSPEIFNKKSACVKTKSVRGLYEVFPDECCRLLKVEPTKEAVKNLDAWITGLRSTEGEVRKDYKEIEIKEGLVKINPILDFTEVDIWRYLAINQIPPNPLYVKGYRSLGCKPCTTLVSDKESERAGRWKGTKKCGGECGIHTQKLK